MYDGFHVPNRHFNDVVAQKFKTYFLPVVSISTRDFFFCLVQINKKVSCGNAHDEIRLAKIAFLTF